jgi:phage gp36-like protein
MPYLVQADYTLRIGYTHLTEILDQAAETSGLTAAQIRANAESWAQAMIKSYLSDKYDMDAEFALTDDTRNFLIRQAMIDLSLCTLHKTINPRDVPEHITKACEEVMLFLQKAQKGELILDIDAPEAGEDDPVDYQHTYLRSQDKFISKPYQDESITADEDEES